MRHPGQIDDRTKKTGGGQKSLVVGGKRSSEIGRFSDISTSFEAIATDELDAENELDEDEPESDDADE